MARPEKPQNVKFQRPVLSVVLDPVKEAIRYGIWIKDDHQVPVWPGQMFTPAQGSSGPIEVRLADLERHHTARLMPGKFMATITANDGHEDSEPANCSFKLNEADVQKLESARSPEDRQDRRPADVKELDKRVRGLENEFRGFREESKLVGNDVKQILEIAKQNADLPKKVKALETRMTEFDGRLTKIDEDTNKGFADLGLNTTGGFRADAARESGETVREERALTPAELKAKRKREEIEAKIRAKQERDERRHELRMLKAENAGGGSSFSWGWAFLGLLVFAIVAMFIVLTYRSASPASSDGLRISQAQIMDDLNRLKMKKDDEQIRHPVIIYNNTSNSFNINMPPMQQDTNEPAVGWVKPTQQAPAYLGQVSQYPPIQQPVYAYCPPSYPYYNNCAIPIAGRCGMWSGGWTCDSPVVRSYGSGGYRSGSAGQVNIGSLDLRPTISHIGPFPVIVPRSGVANAISGGGLPFGGNSSGGFRGTSGGQGGGGGRHR